MAGTDVPLGKQNFWDVPLMFGHSVDVVLHSALLNKIDYTTMLLLTSFILNSSHLSYHVCKLSKYMYSVSSYIYKKP